VLEENKGEVCYVATLQKVKTAAGDLVTMLGLFAVTNARDNLLFCTSSRSTPTRRRSRPASPI